MEKVKGIPLGSSKEDGNVYKLLKWSQQNLWCHSKTDTKFEDSCLRFYQQKTVERLEKMIFLEKERKVVNGLTTGTWRELLNTIEFSQLKTDTFTHFHGDFILDNIMLCEDKNSFKLLDWRQDFDGNLEYGDMYYDLAKLRHNLYFNHLNIVNDLYSVDYDGEEVCVDMKCNYILIKQDEDIKRFCDEQKFSYWKVKILTAIIWLNMAPLYEGKLREFLFYFGKYNLKRVHNYPADEQHPITH